MIRFGEDVCRNLDSALRREWLETNGIGSLGACVNITVQMYAERHQLPLKGVRSALSYSRVLAENSSDSDAAIGMVDQIETEISFAGNPSGEQQQRLVEIAQHCPIHRMLVSQS